MASDTPNSEVEKSENPTADSEQAYAPDELKNEGAGTPAGESATKKGADVNLDLVLDVPVNLSLQVGSTSMSIRELVKLVEGSVIALDRESNQPMDVLVNGTLIAHGEIVLVDDQFGVRLTDVVSPIERIKKLN
jgi:flagellar motor switch protein FliN/FliY